MNKFFISFFLYISILAANADTITFTYNECKHDKLIATADFMIVKNKNNFCVSIQSTKDKQKIRQEMTCDSTFNTITWRHNIDSNTDLFFIRKNDHIEVNGKLFGKPIIKNISIDNRPWYQVVPLGLQTVCQDSAGRAKFWAMSLEEPFMLKPVCFCVAGISNSPMPIHPETACRCIHIKIDGMAQIWKGDYFIRKDNLTFAYYQGFMYGSKKPQNIIEPKFRSWK
jgi:hypothetical protein